MTRDYAIKKMKEEILQLLREHKEDPGDILERYLNYAIDIGSNHFKADAVPVLQIDRHGVIVNEYRSVAEAEAKTGIPQSYISTVLIGRQHSTGGYCWKRKAVVV